MTNSEIADPFGTSRSLTSPQESGLTTIAFSGNYFSNPNLETYIEDHHSPRLHWKSEIEGDRRWLTVPVVLPGGDEQR
jgi:hypothetical protein